MTDPGPPFDAALLYARRAERADADAAAEGRRSRRVSQLRLATAAGAATAALLWATGRGGQAPLVVLPIAIGLFVALAIRHGGIERRRLHAAGLASLNREARARVERRWDALPPSWQPDGLEDHPYAGDLDLFGHASIAQLAGPVHT